MFSGAVGRCLISTLVLVLVLSGFILGASSGLAITITTKTGEEFPAKKITVICWGKEGAPLDITTRVVSEALEKEIGQRVIVENRPGGRGANGMMAVLSRPADGYTILAGTSSYLLYMAGRKDFSPDQFTPLISYVSEPTCIFVKADSQFKSLDELIKYAKTGPKKLNFGVNVVGSTHNHHSWVFANNVIGSKDRFRFVPYKSTAEVAMSVLGEHTDFGCSAPSAVISQYEAGKIRILGVMGKTRWEGAPDVPTFKELGYDLELSIWRGMWVKSGTPEEVVNFLHDTLRKAVQRKEVVSWRKRSRMNDFYMKREKLEKLIEKGLAEALSYNRELGIVK
jgi:tripartite-type tricarboxylate transporter receptor subunit TctC